MAPPVELPRMRLVEPVADKLLVRQNSLETFRMEHQAENHLFK
jgi:hypothetical protein